MKPLPAVGLASSLIQIIDFSLKITRKDWKIYQRTEGDTPAVENHALLQDVANNLYRLSLKLDENELKKLSSDPKRGKLSEPAEHLLKISDETKELVTTLVEGVLQAQARGSFGDPKWQTIREALATVWKKKEITAIKKKLKNTRKDVETNLLLALRQYLDQSAETGLPVFSEGNQIHHVERWQNEAMDAVHAKDFKPKNKKDIEEFSKIVDKLIHAENEAVFCQDVFKMLHFPVLDDRLHSIPAAQEGTFEWIYETPSGEGQPEGRSNLVEWLGSTSGQNLFWITGKPGSGKSTLMKLLLRNSRLFPSLEAWSGASPGITAGFFFWSAGTELQQSSFGLLRSLLWEALQDMIYGPLQKEPGIVQWLFADRWQQFNSYGGGHHAFTFPELRRAFDLMISDISKKFLFLIDGLDELDGYPEAIVELLTTSSKRGNVKIITASRPLPGFQNAFEKRPRLDIDELVYSDIQSVVLSLFNRDDKLAKVRTNQPDNKLESDIISDLAHKAAGSFLWASLATHYLLQTIIDSDDMHSLHSRASAFPTDTDSLLTHIFQNLPTDHRKQASRLFRLVNAHGYPSLLGLSFASDTDTKSSLPAPIRPLKSAELTKRIEDICAQLKHPCMDFLVMYETTPPYTVNPDGGDEVDNEDASFGPDRLKVNFAHRCIRDFLLSGPIWEQIRQETGYDSFNPDEYWANASLWALKTLRPKPRASENDKFAVWEDMAWCIEYALRLEEKDKKVRVTYLDQVGLAGITSHLEQVKSHATDLPEGPAIEGWMDIAVWLNLAGYVSIKAKTADRKELRHAIDYFKALRKRLGTGGEARWIGERRRLKVAYESTSPELLALLEYYAKVVRFATPKPHVEIPEGV